MVELDAANARLKAGKHRCSIQLRGRSFALVATLPERSGAGRKQQRIALGEINLYEAERRAVELGHQLQTKTFTWDAWTEQPPEAYASQLTVDTFQAHAKATHTAKYRASPERGANAWSKKLAPALKKMPPSGPVTEAVLLRIIRLMPEGSAGRRDQGNLLCSIGESLGLELSKARAACRGYGAAQLTPRDIPSDSDIEATWARIKLPHWRWMWGVCAAYGLRPHEAANLKIRPDGKVKVDDSTKTGSRICSACPSNWITEFQLHDLPRPTQAAGTLAKVFGDALERDGITLRPYVLRHAYAIRLISRKIPITISALMMGHSVDVHTRTYHRWITEEQVLAALDGFNL
jgi:hypothetical protein